MQLDNKVTISSLEDRVWHGLKISDSAAGQIIYLLNNDPTVLGLRLSIKKFGCAGFSYIIEKIMQTNHKDYVYENNGAKLYVPMKVMPFIDGTELDYIQEGLNYVFKFNNPKARHICGCGESFSI